MISCDEEGRYGGLYEYLKGVVPALRILVIAPAGFTHTHKGHVPRSGDKYIATSWVMFNRAETIFQANQV